MCDTEEKKHIWILNNLSDCQQPYQHPPNGKEKSIMVYKFKNYFSEKKLSLIVNVRIKSLTCFKHQINIIVVIFVL